MAEIRLKSTGTIKLFENDNTSSVTIASPASLGADRTITLPDASVTLVSGTMNDATALSGTVPIANGGTGSTSTTYASLTANVSGILPAANGGTATTSYTPGITEADQWRITADTAQTGSGRTVLTANWERSDTNFEVIGTGMTESSGIFTFPSTGKWLVQSNQMWSCWDGSSNSAHVYVFLEIQNTTDDSSYDRIARSVSSNSNPAAEYYQNGFVSTIIDITDVSNDKVCISAYRANGLTMQGNSGTQDTGVVFMKLGET